MAFPELVSVRSLGKYKLFLEFVDGVDGEVDLNRLAHQGVFQIWEEPGRFDRVYIDPESKAVAWSEAVDLCPDNLYLQLRNITFQDWKVQHSLYAYH